MDWLRRLESESRAAALNRRLQLLLQHQSLQLEQLAPAAARAAGSDTTVPCGSLWYRRGATWAGIGGRFLIAVLC